MSIRALVVGVATLIWAVPAAAQERGTMEFGAFGSVASFDSSLSLKRAFGGGGRVGMFLDPRLSIEFEDAEMRASRPNGLKDVNVGILSGRLVAVPFKTGALSFLLGAGAGISTETNFMHTYGVDALVGAKLALSDNAAIRLDGVWDWLANQNWKTYKSVRLGLVLYRRPARQTRTVTVVTPAPPPVMLAHEDSVSAAETRRLRDRDAALQALRDSLGSAPATTNLPMSEATIHFDFDKSDIRTDAQSTLNAKVPYLKANAGMRIRIEGNTDERGSDEYNLALGERRAVSAKKYLVDHGVDAGRIDIISYGEERPVCKESTATCMQQNRRDDFRILMMSGDSTKAPQ